MTAQRLAKLAAKFHFELGATPPRQVQQQPARLFMTAVDRHHELDTVAAAFSRDDSYQLQWLQLALNHVAADGRDLVLCEWHVVVFGVGRRILLHSDGRLWT